MRRFSGAGRTVSKTTVFDTTVVLCLWTGATRDGSLKTGYRFAAEADIHKGLKL
jgi:hypothetical protein